jgi:hypothetical protein
MNPPIEDDSCSPPRPVLALPTGDPDSDALMSKFRGNRTGTCLETILDLSQRQHHPWLGIVVSEALWIYHDRIFYRREHSAWSRGLVLLPQAAPSSSNTVLRRRGRLVNFVAW